MCLSMMLTLSLSDGMAGTWVRWRLSRLDVADVLGLEYVIFGCAVLGGRGSPRRAVEYGLTPNEGLTYDSL